MDHYPAWLTPEYPQWVSLSAFQADRGGGGSVESDYGSRHWYRPPSGEAPREWWRVSVVHDTGDVYASNYKTGQTFLLGVVTPSDADRATAKAARPPGNRDPVEIAAEKLFAEGNSRLGAQMPLRVFSERLWIHSTFATWPDIDAFYAERGGRWSGESEFGQNNFFRDYGEERSHWDDRWVVYGEERSHWDDHWVVAVVAETGDVYAKTDMDMGGIRVVLLGTIQPTDEDVRLSESTQSPIPYPPIYLAANRRFNVWVNGKWTGRPLTWFADRAK